MAIVEETVGEGDSGGGGGALWKRCEWSKRRRAKKGCQRFDAMKIAEGGRALLVPYKGVGDEICALRGKRNLHSSTTVQR